MQDDCDFEDSLCTTGVLDNLEKIESWNTNSSPLASSLLKVTTHLEHSNTTPHQHPTGVSRDQLTKSNPSGLRRSPRIRLQQLNRQKNVLVGEIVEGPYHEDIENKKGPKNPLLTLGDETMGTVGTRELHENIQEFQLPEPKMGDSMRQLQTELPNAIFYQESPQNLYRSDFLKPSDNENQCAKDFIYSSSTKKGVTRNSSLNTHVSAAKWETEQGSNVCEKKASSDRKEICKEVGCGSRILKDRREQHVESQGNVNHSNEGSRTQEAKVLTNNSLKHLSNSTCNKRQNKENVQSFKDSIGKKKIASKMFDNKLEDGESFSSLPETGLKYNEIIPNAGVSGQQCNTKIDSSKKLGSNFSTSVNEVEKNEDDILGNFYRRENTTEKTGSIVLKSPINCRDSQSFLSSQEKMELTAWGLPDAVLKVMWVEVC